jgi:hypothetical protein
VFKVSENDQPLMLICSADCDELETNKWCKIYIHVLQANDEGEDEDQMKMLERRLLV